MPISIRDRFKNAWNVFRYGENLNLSATSIGTGQSYRPDRNRMYLGNERSLVSSIYTRIGIDVSSIRFRHARVEEDRYIETINSGLNNCLSLEANIDQTGRAFIQDVVMSLCDEGSVAIVPVDYSVNPFKEGGSFDILSLRTGKVQQWYPEHVRINLYNQKTGLKEDIVLPKVMVAIIENPLYSVMNEPNSTLRRLVDKLNLLDAIDKQSGSGKLDLIIQLPYVIKTPARKQQAEERRQDIEAQLLDSKYGIAYTDGTEKITQLNRPAENNLLTQIEYLTSMLYSQLGMTKEIFEGNADEPTMINYYNRTIEPFVSAITDSMRRTFLTKTARSQGQSIVGIRDPFKLVPVKELAEIVDKFTRNEVATANEFRSVIGFKPSKDPGADELRNKNLNEPTESKETEESPQNSQNGRSLVNAEE